ncbi:MAG: sel1 repeat family protein [Alphaproteobacteria bacterium]|nr:sel1 repeat family protein [Alphaproteobacteria bacterium]
MLTRVLIASLFLFLSAGLASAFTNPDADFRKARAKFQTGDYSKAASLLIRAVEHGHEAAQVPLAAMYRSGQGVKQNLPRAFELFTKAAYQGYPNAQFTLAMMYRLGQGTQPDHAEAGKWFRRAAEVGHAEAQNSLGVMFETGRGVDVNYVSAVMWYHVAASSGSRRGVDNQKRLSKKLSVKEVARAKRLALACMRSRYKSCG